MSVSFVLTSSPCSLSSSLCVFTTPFFLGDFVGDSITLIDLHFCTGTDQSNKSENKTIHLIEGRNTIYSCLERGSHICPLIWWYKALLYFLKDEPHVWQAGREINTNALAKCELILENAS